MHQIVEDWRQADLSALDQALCAFSEKLTRHPHDIGRSDIETLQNHGLSDVAIHDAVQVIGYFNYINRVADGLGVELEDEAFVKTWEKPPA